MPRLIYLSGAAVGQEISFAAEGRLVVGREDSAGLRIPHGSISREHAEIRSEGGRLVLRDLKSTNGTSVNGKKITEIALHPGDEIQFGQVLLRLAAEAPPAPPPPPEESEEIVLPGAEPEAPPAPTKAPSRQPRPVSYQAPEAAPPAPARMPAQPAGQILQGDVSQYGGVPRLLIYLAIGLICAGIFWGAKYLGSALVPSGSTTDVVEED